MKLSEDYKVLYCQGYILQQTVDYKVEKKMLTDQRVSVRNSYRRKDGKKPIEKIKAKIRGQDLSE